MPKDFTHVPIKFTYILDVYEKEFFAWLVEQSGEEATAERVKAKAIEYAKKGINGGLRQIFEMYKMDKKEGYR